MEGKRIMNDILEKIKKYSEPLKEKPSLFSDTMNNLNVPDQES
jgi:hypothetical protein